MNFLAQDAVHLGQWFTGPIATDTGSKTHAITTNEDGDIEAHQLVHSTGAVTTTELEATFGSSGNDHSPCAIAELDSGKLIALWTEAGTGPITYKISTNVDDSTAWDSAQTLGSGNNHSYAQVIRLTGEGSGSGRLYVFTRTPDSPKRQQYYYSDDDASSWNGPYDLARCIAADELSYCVFSSNGVDRIDVFSSVVESSGTRNREDVYHFYLQNEEAFASDGTSLGTRGGGDFPLVVDTDCTQVYDSSTGDEAWVWGCVTDGDQPAVVFATFPDRDTDHDYYWAKYDSVNDDWNDVYKVADAGGLIVSPSVTENHYSGGICFDGDDPDAVYASIGDHTSGCRLVRMTRSGSTWSEDFTVCGSPGNYIQNIRPVVPATTGTVSARCKVLWVHAGIYNDQDSYSSDVMYLSDAEEVAAAGWTGYIDYTVASGQVTGGLDTNGLMAAMITHANLSGDNATAFWAGVQDGGADIRACVNVVDDGNGDFTAEHTLPVDVYYCDTSTQKLKMRVCLPVAYEGLEINILFGNSGASANTNLIGHDSDGFPGAKAVWTPRLYAMVPDFTVASGNITDRSANGKTLIVRGTPDYAQTDQWGGPGAMYFTGADDDMAYAEEQIGRGAMVLITPDLEATTENAEIWFFLNGNSSVGGRYIFGRIDDLTAPHDVEAYTVGGSGNTAVRDDESFTGFVQVHAALPINNSDVDSHLQVNDRTEQTAATGNIGALNSTSINGLRTPSFIPRGRATYHEEWFWAPSRFPDSDALDTYWANHDDPATFWDEGTVVEISAGGAALSGTLGGSDEDDIRTGGRTTILTLTGDTWVAAGTTFNAQRQNIIDGVSAASSPANGWNNVVRDAEDVASVVRTSDTVVTITWSAAASYDVTAGETITATVPASALVTSGDALVASPTAAIGALTDSAAISGTLGGADESQVRAGGLTTVITLTEATWLPEGSSFNAVRQAIIDGCTSAQSETNGWNNEVRDNEDVTSVERTSDTVVTITWSAAAAYNVTANETITVTVPSAALVGTPGAITASPTQAASFIAPSVAVGGTARGAYEAEIVDGGKTIVLTLTEDTWIAAGTGPVGTTAQTQALIDGITSAQSETNGWNNVVRDTDLSPSDVARTSDTVVTITLPASASYSITAGETITATIPAAVLTTSADPLVASPTISIREGERPESSGSTRGFLRGVGRMLH